MVSEKFQVLVDERSQILRSRSREELLELQVCPTEEVTIDGRTGTIDVIVEKGLEGSLRVVVQGFLNSKWFPWLGVKSVSLAGFRMGLDGSLTELRDEEFYEFD